MLTLVRKVFDDSHPGFPQTILLLESLCNLTQQKAQATLDQIPNASIYFYSFLRTSLIKEKDPKKLFCVVTLTLMLLKDAVSQKDTRVTAIVQSDDELEKRLLELIPDRKKRILGEGLSMQVELGLLFLAVMKTKSRESWDDFLVSKTRLSWLFKLATDNKRAIRKNALSFLKKLLRDTVKLFPTQMSFVPSSSMSLMLQCLY